MSIDSSTAARFYRASSDMTAPADIGGGGASAGPDLRGAAASFVETMRAGETTATAGLAGQADAQSVVTALASTEMAVQTAVTLRDRVVEAYQEILRMPV
ncbi:MAG: flagellar hook-basal body complex protein FliE [Pseudomonadota bacterium]